MIKKLVSFFSVRISLFVYKLIPGLSKSRIDSILFVPKKHHKIKINVPAKFKQFLINTRDGEVLAYQTGNGPCVIFVHGWNGGAYQFFPLMRGLSRCGFTALAFDHIGHGQSEPKPATLHQFIKTVNAVLQYARKKSPDGVYALVGHSTGCIAIANASNPLIRNMPLFLISPIFNFKLFFLKKLAKLNIHPTLVKQYAAQFSKSYAIEYKKLELSRNLQIYHDVSVIAHDQSDRESPVSDSVRFCTKFPLTKLLVTKQYGHERIINSESVWQELKSHLNYEDTTINFVQQILEKE